MILPTPSEIKETIGKKKDRGGCEFDYWQFNDDCGIKQCSMVCHTGIETEKELISRTFRIQSALAKVKLAPPCWNLNLNNLTYVTAHARVWTHKLDGPEHKHETLLCKNIKRVTGYPFEDLHLNNWGFYWNRPVVIDCADPEWINNVDEIEKNISNYIRV